MRCPPCTLRAFSPIGVIASFSYHDTRDVVQKITLRFRIRRVLNFHIQMLWVVCVHGTTFSFEISFSFVWWSNNESSRIWHYERHSHIERSPHQQGSVTSTVNPSHACIWEQKGDTMSEDIDKHVLRKYHVGQKLGKGVSNLSIHLRIIKLLPCKLSIHVYLLCYCINLNDQWDVAEFCK